ncbi:MAG: hypothetical protein HUU21_31635 [Polyangiaceae bacterium]|nr:hypothetical protein [Polyangiaceae bacterium]NUQ78107.1 hypothetical protein [Polyangiaceae bacterium]
MKSRSLVWIPATVLVLAGACSLAVDLDGLSGAPPSGGDAGADDDAGPTGCAHVTYPPPPASAAEGGDIDFTVAVRAIDIGEGTSNTTGLDLDKTCTCHFNEGASCIYPPYSADKDHCDDPEGRDNSIAKLFETFSLFIGQDEFGSKHFSDRAEMGRWSLLIRVYGYNGEPDDAQVTLAIYPTGWNDAALPAPAWDGNDVWPASAASLEDGVSLEKPRFTDPKAYVSGGVLVGTLPEVLLNLSGTSGDLGVRLTAGTLMGRIEKTGDRYNLTGSVIAARWKATDLFRVTSSIEVNDKPLCNDGSFEYKQFKEIVCGHVDIASSLGAPSTVCDALSFGMNFSTEPALLGTPYTPDVDPPPCSPEQDPANDSCDL